MILAGTESESFTYTFMYSMVSSKSILIHPKRVALSNYYNRK